MHNVEFRNLYCLSDIGILKNSGKMGKEYGMHGSDVILKRFLIGEEAGKSLFRMSV